MRAIEFRQFGDVSQLHLVDRPNPRATVSTAVVRIEAASVNPSDVKNVAAFRAAITPEW
jgi:NADPH:quinone reductase-like Zn-dependent oxidoreductase